ncbi:MAG: hypothetical protein F4Z34_08120 [Acidimicrobiaceae bacterium]|nr:hypothetical protein [Acidimicrobiaceae bacterium]
MPRLLARAVRLEKIGAVAGAVVGVGRLILQRRRSQADESSWPTIAETAAQNGQPVDEAGTAEAEADGDDPGDGDEPDDKTEEES